MTEKMDNKTKIEFFSEILEYAYNLKFGFHEGSMLVFQEMLNRYDRFPECAAWFELVLSNMVISHRRVGMMIVRMFMTTLLSDPPESLILHACEASINPVGFDSFHINAAELRNLIKYSEYQIK